MTAKHLPPHEVQYSPTLRALTEEEISEWQLSQAGGLRAMTPMEIIEWQARLITLRMKTKELYNDLFTQEEER